MAHEGKIRKLKVLWKRDWGKAIRIPALQVMGGQEYGGRLEDVRKEAAAEDQNLFCAHLFWSSINVSM